jgi:uncharacterized protein YerC
MPQLSKRKLNPIVEKNILDSLSYLLKELKTKDDADIFLNSLLTDTELKMLSKRLAAAYLLKEGVSEQKISDTLKLTNTTISRLKMWVTLRDDGFKIIFNKLNNEKNLKIAKEIFIEITKYAIKASAGKAPKYF